MNKLQHQFNGEYELILKAERLLNDDSISDVIELYRSEFHHYPASISLSFIDTRETEEPLTIIDGAILENLETLKELILPDSLEKIMVTDKAVKILKENDVLIRGNFDSYAESLAEDLGLHFRPCDQQIARFIYEPAQQTTTVTIIFYRNGTIKMKEDISSSASADDHFQASFYRDLPDRFYETKTAEQIARQFRDVICEQILEEGKLNSFLQKARTCRIYSGRN